MPPGTRTALALLALVTGLALAVGTSTSAAGRPGPRLLVAADSPAARQAAAWGESRPADARLLRRIAAQPQATWLGEWSGDVRGAVAGLARQGEAARATPVLVAYAVPHRDCGGASGGGLASERAYRAWIDAFAAGLGRAPAIVVLEPDALAGLDCLPAGAQRARLALLAHAVRALGRDPRAAVYLDAGHAGWGSPGRIATRLRRAGVAGARGFSLNVSYFDRTASEVAYGRAVGRLLGGKPFVIDTSRNGNGPAPGGAWCNPSGRALGVSPTTRTGVRDVDALLWVKSPGESDGPCGGGPAAGAWWPQYALGLARRAR